MDLYGETGAMRRDAVISPCGLYRYSLMREWNYDQCKACFIMLNPSTADGTIDDPTIRKCIGFARQRDRGGIVVVNLFAFRATKPADMLAVADPIGPENDAHILRAVGACNPVVAAWGVDGGHLGRDRAVMKLIRDHHTPLFCLGTTKDGHPRHPLYVPYEQKWLGFGDELAVIR